MVVYEGVGTKQTVACPGPYPGMDLFIQSLAKPSLPAWKAMEWGGGKSYTPGMKGSRLVESVSESKPLSRPGTSSCGL